MPRTKNVVPLNPKVLIWARESVGLTQEKAAEALRVPIETIQAWEADASEIGISDLRNIARAYKRPVGALLQPEAPALPPLPEDFRTVGGDAPSFSVSTMVAIREAQRIQEIATELLADDPELYPTAELTQADESSDSAQELGLLERETFEVGIDEQLKWASENYAYNAWRTKIQNQGIITLAKPMPRGDCHGFSVYAPGNVPVIVVNSAEVDQAKIFTLFHEYAHLTLSREGVCLERDQVDTERWCNRFASSLLVPYDTIREAVGNQEVTSIDTVRDLAHRFKVSRHVIAIRLNELDLASPALYAAIRQEDREFIDWQKPEIPEDDDFGGRPQDAVRLSEVGVGFSNIVLSALARDEISPTDASEFLDMREDKFPDLTDRVQKARDRYG